MRQLTIYIRPGCHLCEDMLTQLQSIDGADSFQLQLVEIDADAALRARYDTRVPVLEGSDGELLSEYFLDEIGLRNYLNGG